MKEIPLTRGLVTLVIMSHRAACWRKAQVKKLAKQPKQKKRA